MYLARDRLLGRDVLVFTYADPRQDGYLGGPVEENVELDYDILATHRWLEGEQRPEPRLGRDPRDPRKYKVFKSAELLRSAGFVEVHPDVPFVDFSWADYRRRHDPAPEVFAKSMTPDEWFDFLEEADSAARVRRTLSEPDLPTQATNREEVAEWIAKRHMGADGGIQQIWYLPTGSPANEIRLLEVNDRYVGDSATVAPIEIGYDAGGAKFKLLVADVSGEHLNRIKRDPSHQLPEDWKIDTPIIWGRRGRM